VEASTITQECFSSLIVDAPNCECTLITEDISDTIFLCPGDTFVLIPEILGAQGLAFSTWISDVTLMRPTLPLFESGTWIWIVEDSVGCESRDTFDVVMRELITMEAITISPSCEGVNNGLIILEDIEGGTPPFTVQLDAGTPFLPGALPDTLKNISVGLHSITISNLDGCETSSVLMINPAVSGHIDLGPDVSIPEGDSVWITPVFNNIIPEIIEWDPASIQHGLADFWFSPEGTTLISLQVIDSFGCIYQDELLITVLIEQLIYIPTSFSPNGDQINDRFEIFTSEGHQPIESLEIFDRWGNMIYRQTGTGPFIWDGVAKTKEAPSGVYVVKILWKDFDGDQLFKVSDLTLIR
jgi:gliding motility-associated-like protein